MNKTKAIRLAGFVGALCASGALIGTAVSGTGAYFTDSHTGSINAGTGHIRVDVSPSDGQLNFDNLLPGNYKDQTVSYTAHPSSGTEDLWLVFPTDGSAEAFVGTAGDSLGGGLGRFGHFALSSSGGANFTSYNLNNAGAGSHSGATCPTDGNGWGGSNAQPSSPSDTTSVAFCAPPNAILLQSGMSDGNTGNATLTFGFTPLLTNGKNSVGNVDNHNEDVATHPVVSYKIVATQHGILPNDPFNG